MILGIVVLLFGAKKLPALATGLGGAMRAFKKSVIEPDELEGTKPAAAEPEAEKPAPAEPGERAAAEHEADDPPRDQPPPRS